MACAGHAVSGLLLVEYVLTKILKKIRKKKRIPEIVKGSLPLCRQALCMLLELNDECVREGLALVYEPRGQ